MTSTATHGIPTASTPTARTRLPMGNLIALAAVIFMGVVTEIVPAGVLTLMSRDLGVTPSLVGQLVTVYAITTAITAIPLTALTRRVPRKTLLIVLVLGFAVVNAVTAVATGFVVIVIARIVGGMLAGLLWAMAAGYAMRMVRQEHSGRALSVAMIGTPLAFVFGMPIATALGSTLGWRAAFGVVALVAVSLSVLAWLKLPSVAGEPSGRQATFRSVLRMPGLIGVLAATGAFVLAHNIAYTYIAPLMAAAGLEQHLDLVLVAFGVMAVVGVLLAGTLIDRQMRTAVVIASALLASALAVVGMFASQPMPVLIATAVWGLAYGSAPTLFQAAPARIAGDNADVAQAMVVATWNGAIAAGAAIGGVVLGTSGSGALPWPALALALAAGVIALSARAAFRRARSSTTTTPQH